MPRRTIVTVLSAAGILLASAALAGCTSRTDAAPEPTVTKTVTAAPAPVASTTPTVRSTPLADVASLLKSAPVPAVCRHPAGTLVNGVLPGQPASSGEVELSSGVETGAGPYQASGSVTGIPGTAVAASITCNAGGVPWPDVIAFYRVQGTGLQLVGSYSLDTLSNDVATTGSVSIADGAVKVTWTGPGRGQSEADGSNRQSASFALSGGQVVASGYTHSD